MADYNHEDNPEAAWKLVKKIGTAMFVTRDGDELEGSRCRLIPIRTLA